MTLRLAFLILIGSAVSSLSLAATYEGLGAKSVSPETVAQFAAPPLDPSLSRKLQGFMDIRSPGLGKITSDGKKLFFGWSITGTYQIWRIDGPQKFPVQMTGGEDNSRLLGITPNDKYLLISRDRKGEENPGLYLQPTSGGALIPIQHKEGVQSFLSYVTNDSNFVYFKANDIKPDSYAIYRYNIKSSEKELVFNQPGIWDIADVFNEKIALLQKATGSITSEYFTYNLETKELVPVIGQGEKEQYDVSFGTSVDEFFVLTPKFGEFKQLYRFSKGKFKSIASDSKMDIASFFIDFPRQKIFYETNDRGYFRVKALDAKTFHKIALPDFKGAEQVATGGSSRNGRFTTFGVETPKAPRTSFVYDWQNHKLTQWVLPSAPEIDTTQFVASKLESYPARDGTPIPMFVRRPAKCANEPCPVIVNFHGGPEAQSTPGFDTFAQFLVQNGFIYVEPNVRGSDGYGKTWLNSDNGAKRLDVVTDIEDCAKFIKSEWKFHGVTPKVGIMGGSYGGYSTLIGMSKFAGAYDAGVEIVGMSNLITFLMNTAPYRRALRVSEYGDPEKDREALVQLSPITFIDKIKDPMLLIQGLNDPRVPVGEALQIYTALKNKNVPSSLIIFADEGHGASKRENQVLELGHAFLFFKKYLAAAPSPSVKP